MELSVTGQLYQMVVSLAAGAGLGLVYDLFRAWRRCAGGRHTAADLLFWGIACAGRFWLGMAAGDGQLRIFMAVSAALGAAGYSLLCSRFVVPALCRGLAFSGRLGRALLRPVRTAGKNAKKFLKSRKNLFPKRKHWFTIKLSLIHI